MKAYIYCADIYCEPCALAIKATLPTYHDDGLTWAWEARDSDHTPQGPYSDGGGEADTPQHCGRCRLFLCNPLTSDGEDYVRVEAVTASVPEEWREHYDYLF